MNDPKGAAPLMADARLRRVSPFRKALIRPELGAICGTIAVFVFFLMLAPASGMFSLEGVMNWGTVSAQFMIIAVGACLLMIAGEFDLSVGSMIGFSGIVIALLSTSFGFPMWLAILSAFAVSLAIGALNGFLILRTGLPSFIVTLAALFILRGLTTYIPILTNGSTIIGGLKAASAGDWLAPVFGGKILQGLFAWLAEQGVIGTFKAGPKAGQPIVDGIPMLMVWALGLAIVAHVVLTRTVFGSWIFAAGGDANAARNVGVPVGRVKVCMFMLTAFCATVLATCQVLEFGSAAADRGLLKEFEAIIAAVIGGTLLTGGYGTVAGAALGAVIFGVVQQGLFFAGVESSLFRVFLGLILLVAVVLNTYIRRIITGER
ncbi:ABC transporter permease [Labrys neptuniae]|uniref:Xylose transport system permease protein XylH n=2 Tax=Labrys neptuniae TaxID=376174 RepID=A0ABV3PNN0_9HYPH|nr:ABC transporter permease [Labrys neptuniae]MDT3378449.1 ABC transporter permease [Labrys neptuniae]